MHNCLSTLAALVMAVLCGAQIAAAQTSASSDEPMMVKSQSGIELGGDIDLTMCANDGVGVGGYDLVSYRDNNGPVMGRAELSAEYDGLTYWFSTDDNRVAFLDNPSRYIPAYSGFCAITLALGRVTCPEFDNFKIEDDRLLLFEVTGFTNGRVLWNSDSSGFKHQADINFERLQSQQ